MRGVPGRWAAIVAVLLTTACGGGSNPAAPIGMPVDDPTFQFLESRQRFWCERITGETCAVYVSVSHPTWAAWVDWSLRSPAVFWNHRVLIDRQFWITDPRMAHEACHLKHGPQPEWSAQQKEDFADHCAIQYAGAAP